MATSRDKYYTKVYETLVYYNDRNYAPLSNEKIRKEIHKVIAEEEVDARNINLDVHNVTADNFCQTPVTPNTQGENENAILTIERLNNSDVLAESLKGLTINDAGYYESESANENNAKGDPASDPKVYTHTSDRNKIKVTGTSNGNLQQKLLSNRTLPIITTKIDPPILDRVETCGGTPHALATPTTKGVITDKTHSSARIL